MKRLAFALACVALAGCGADDEPQSAEIPPRATPAPVVTTPSEGGVIEDVPVEQPEAEKRKAAGKPKTTTSSSTPATPATPPSAEPATAPNSAGPYGPAEERAPKAKSTSPARKEIATTVETYLKAIAAGNGKRACEQMSAAGQKAVAAKLAQIAPETRGAACSESIVLYQGAYGDAIKRPKVTSVRVNGRRATAVGPLKQVARLERRGGRWLIAEYGQ